MTSRILVVDDERVVTEVVERYLRLENYEVSLASNGHQALQTAREWHPDLIVLDLMLPGMDGLEVCRKIRKESVMPIIMPENLDSRQGAAAGIVSDRHAFDDAA